MLRSPSRRPWKDEREKKAPSSLLRRKEKSREKEEPKQEEKETRGEGRKPKRGEGGVRPDRLIRSRPHHSTQVSEEGGQSGEAEKQRGVEQFGQHLIRLGAKPKETPVS